MNIDSNYGRTKSDLGYVSRKDATQADYDRIGFMSGLEVHQQLLTDKKLFCRCPARIYQKEDDYDAEIIRHMRPTLSELGEYDGTALMEFKTRKNIIYRLKNETACTYEIDDTPPFPINKEALEISIVISHLCKLNIVGEVHITRKQYLDGSIPTGFQRTGIVGVEGVIHLKNKNIRLIQLSVEEDSCREVSDIGHWRIFRTDRLGMPLIETVTYPDMVNPEEVKEACDYIRFLNRSTGLVRTGMGAGRQDVNVSCRGGTRVEIKGVAHTKWIPELTHNECFRQWALLNIKKKLLEKVAGFKNWKIKYSKIDSIFFSNKFFSELSKSENEIYAVKLPYFKNILSHFTQPDQCFANEISDRLKVIACIEKPNMTHSEAFEKIITDDEMSKIYNKLSVNPEDAIVVFWGQKDDMETALETIEERCKMAFEGVPNESRKSFADGTTLFERVLPGADRMYPDTDSPPIPLSNDYIDMLSENLPNDVIERYRQLIEWDVPEHTYTFIFKANLFPLLEKIYQDLDISPKFVGTFLGQKLKNIMGKYKKGKDFNYNLICDLFKFLKDNNIYYEIAGKMLVELYQHPQMDFDSILVTLKFKRYKKEDIFSKVDYLKTSFYKSARNPSDKNMVNSVMGELNPVALGNVQMSELFSVVNRS